MDRSILKLLVRARHWCPTRRGAPLLRSLTHGLRARTPAMCLAQENNPRGLPAMEVKKILWQLVLALNFLHNQQV